MNSGHPGVLYFIRHNVRNRVVALVAHNMMQYVCRQAPQPYSLGGFSTKELLEPTKIAERHT